MNTNGVQAGGPEGPLFSLFRPPEKPEAFPADEKHENRRFYSVASLNGQVEDWCLLVFIGGSAISFLQ